MLLKTPKTVPYFLRMKKEVMGWDGMRQKKNNKGRGIAPPPFSHGNFRLFPQPKFVADLRLYPPHLSVFGLLTEWYALQFRVEAFAARYATAFFPVSAFPTAHKVRLGNKGTA